MTKKIKPILNYEYVNEFVKSIRLTNGLDRILVIRASPPRHKENAANIKVYAYSENMGIRHAIDMPIKHDLLPEHLKILVGSCIRSVMFEYLKHNITADGELFYA